MRRWKHLETVRRNTRPFTRGSKTAKLLSAFADASCEGTAAWLRWNEGNCAERITDVDGRHCLDAFEVTDFIVIFIDSIWFYARVNLNHIHSGHHMASYIECSRSTQKLRYLTFGCFEVSWMFYHISLHAPCIRIYPRLNSPWHISNMWIHVSILFN